MPLPCAGSRLRDLIKVPSFVLAHCLFCIHCHVFTETTRTRLTTLMLQVVVRQPEHHRLTTTSSKKKSKSMKQEKRTRRNPRKTVRRRRQATKTKQWAVRRRRAVTRRAMRRLNLTRTQAASPQRPRMQAINAEKPVSARLFLHMAACQLCSPLPHRWLHVGSAPAARGRGQSSRGTTRAAAASARGGAAAAAAKPARGIDIMQALLLGCFLCVCALLVANAAIRPRRPPIVQRLVVSVVRAPPGLPPTIACIFAAFMCI